MTPKRKEHRKKCQKKHLILCFLVIWEAINANAVPEWKCRRLANAGGGQCYHLSALWCSPSGVSNWYNVNKQVNDSRDMHKKTMLTRSAVSNCQRDFFFSFFESWGRSMRDLWECQHVTSAVLQCAVICTKKTLFLLKTRAGSLSFNCKGFKHESSFPSSQQPSCHTLTLNETSSALHVLCNIAPSVLPESSIDNCVQVKLLQKKVFSKIYFPFKKIFWMFSN